MKTLVVFITALLFSSTAYAAGLTIDKSATNTDLSAVTGSITIGGSAIGGGGGGAWTFISSQTASSSASIGFTSGIDSTYDVYMFTYSDVDPATDGVTFGLRIDTNGGASFEASGYAFHNQTNYATQAYSYTGSYSAATFILCNDLGSHTPEAASGRVFLIAPAGTTHTKMIWSDGLGITAQANFGSCRTFGGWDGGGSAINAIQFIMSSGNIAAGTFALYGLSKS